MSVQNRSTAVMQRRRVAPDSLDYFPTPPFATRALCEFLRSGPPNLALDILDVWEPACGELHMVHPLCEFFRTVRATDVHQYGDHGVMDFLFFGDGEPKTDWIITNRPFLLAEQFIQTALRVAQGGVAMLLRGAFLEGQDRHASLFDRTPPDYVLQFTERVVMLADRLIRAGDVDPFADKPGTKASTATSYCWFVWLGGGTEWRDTRLRWIAPCRHKLERPGDYPDYFASLATSTDFGLFRQGARVAPVLDEKQVVASGGASVGVPEESASIDGSLPLQRSAHHDSVPQISSPPVVPSQARQLSAVGEPA